MVRGPDEELDAAFAAIVRERADAVVIQGSLSIKRMAELAVAHRLPSTTRGLCGRRRPNVIRSRRSRFVSAEREVVQRIGRSEPPTAAIAHRAHPRLVTGSRLVPAYPVVCPS
jgi:hypothetical protein